MAVVILDCPSCQSRGRVYDPISDTVVRCACWPKRTALLALEKANIAPEYRESTFAEIIPRPEFPNQKDVIDTCRAYAQDWAKVKVEGRCLAILGKESSMGKSHLAVSICLDLIERFWTESVIDQDVCMFVNVEAGWFRPWQIHFSRYPGVDRGTSEWNDRMDDPEFWRERKVLNAFDSRMRSTELLVLDDLAKFDRSRRGNLEKLYSVIEHRASHGLPMIVTENAESWDQLSEKLGPEFGPPITDRIKRNGDLVVVQMPLTTKRRRKKAS